jgi:hypothetical protein
MRPTHILNGVIVFIEIRYNYICAQKYILIQI